jgi:hypothetical protein
LKREGKVILDEKEVAMLHDETKHALEKVSLLEEERRRHIDAHNVWKAETEARHSKEVKYEYAKISDKILLLL